MATSETTKKRQQYRSNSVRLTAVGRAAALLLDTYTWMNSDGRVMFTTEPNIAAVGDPALMDFEVKSRWAGLRASLLVAGIITGEQEPGFLPDGMAKFLVVQTLDLATAVPLVFDWQTRAEFEVLTGVNSFGYADGAALDIFYDFLKAVEVRVQLRSLAFGDRTDYLAGDRHGVNSTVTVGNIMPFSTPDVSVNGWACIGDRSQNPEPNYFGLDSPRVVIINTGVEGPPGVAGLKGDMGIRGSDGQRGEVGQKGDRGLQGDQGPAGPQGPRGLPGTGGGGSVAPVVLSESPQETDKYVLMQPLRLMSAITGDLDCFEEFGVRCLGGDDSDAGANLAGIAAAAWLEAMGMNEVASRNVGPGNPDGVPMSCKLIRVIDGAVCMRWVDGLGAQQFTDGKRALVKQWLAGTQLAVGGGYAGVLRAGMESFTVTDFAPALAPDRAGQFEVILGTDGTSVPLHFDNNELNTVVAQRRNDEQV